MPLRDFAERTRTTLPRSALARNKRRPADLGRVQGERRARGGKPGSRRPPDRVCTRSTSVSWELVWRSKPPVRRRRGRELELEQASIILPSAIADAAPPRRQIAALLILPPALPPSFPTATAFLALLEQQLTLRTFLVSHSISLADWALWGAVRNNSIARAQLGQFVHVSRWSVPAFASRQVR